MYNDEFLPISILGSSYQSPSGKDGALKFINKLEGYKTKFKNLHWSASNDMLHQRVDQLLSDLSEFQDEVSEDLQGTFGQFDTNSIKGSEVNGSDALGVLKALETDVINYRKHCKDNDDYIGVVNELEGFCHTIKKHIYLFKICNC